MYCWLVPDWRHHLWRHEWKPTYIHKFKKILTIFFVSIKYFKDFLTISDKLLPGSPRYGFWHMHWHVPVVLLTKPYINGRDKSRIHKIFILIYFQLAMLIILNVTSYRFVLILAWLIHIFMACHGMCKRHINSKSFMLFYFLKTFEEFIRAGSGHFFHGAGRVSGLWFWLGSGSGYRKFPRVHYGL